MSAASATTLWRALDCQAAVVRLAAKVWTILPLSPETGRGSVRSWGGTMPRSYGAGQRAAPASSQARTERP